VAVAVYRGEGSAHLKLWLGGVAIVCCMRGVTGLTQHDDIHEMIVVVRRCLPIHALELNSSSVETGRRPQACPCRGLMNKMLLSARRVVQD
jgi:hypothetical protein